MKLLIRSNSKVFENFEFDKLQEMLLKKINYFYKIYIRQLKKNFPDLNSINDLLIKDIDEYKKNKITQYNLDYDNLSKRDDYEMNIETLLIMGFFREFDGRNPLIKNQISNKIDLNNLNQELESKEFDLKSQIKKDATLPLPEDYFTFLELSVEDKIKFYFWINVGGLTTASDSRGALHEVFNKYHFLKVLPKAINGFKLMNDHKEMLNHILPKIKNNNQKLLEHL